MKRFYLIFVLALPLALAACQPEMLRETAPPATVPAPASPNTAPTTEPTQAAIPTTAQPAPTNTVPAATPIQDKTFMPQSPASNTGSAYPPEPKDSTMTRGNFFVDSADLRPAEGKPGYYTLSVDGSLPTPCNLPRVVVHPPDASGQIVVSAYTVVPKDQMCTQVIKPFTGKIAELGGYPSGKYKVVINDIEAGVIDVP